MCANTFAMCAIFWNCVEWAIDQDRSFEAINSFKPSDVVIIVANAIVATLTQTFMAVRCWRILNKSIIFAVLVAALILGAFSGAIWLAVVTAIFSSFEAEDAPIFIASEMWLWCSVLTDVVILVSLTRHFLKLRKGFNRNTDALVTSFAVLAFETFFVPCFFALAAAITYATTWDSETLWAASDALMPALPSLYLLSFVACIRGSELRRHAQQGSLGGTLDGSISGSKGRVIVVKQPQSQLAYPSFALSAARSMQFASSTQSVSKPEEDVSASKPTVRYSGISVMQHQVRFVESDGDDCKATEV